jgi:plastocyanin
VRISGLPLRNVGRTFSAALVILCTGSAHAAVIQIKVQNLAFTPVQVTAQIGDTIEWMNADFVAHTATARDGAWDIMLPANSTRTVVLKSAGKIDYYCRFHPNMTGQILVPK